MHWDVNELKEKYNILHSLYQRVNKPLIKKEIWNDMYTLNTMIVLYDKGFDKKIDPIYSPAEDKQCRDYLLDKYDEIIKALNEYYQIRMKNRRPENVVIEDYDSLIKDFLNNYQPEIMPVYNNLVENNHLELNTKKDFEPSYNGLCLYNSTFNEYYVFARYNGKILSSLYLPHELGHAYQANQVEIVRDFDEKRSSWFVEVYSTYLEQLFFHYLKEKGYNKQAYYLEKGFWTHFINDVEYQMMLILNTDLFLNSHCFTYIISKLVSTIAYNDFLKHNNHKMINEFNNIFLNGSDYDIVNEYKLSRILHAGYDSLDRLIK